MARVSKTSPFQSQRQTQPKSNTEHENKEEEERKEESKGDDEKKGTSSGSSSDEKKKGKRPMKRKKRKQKMRSINEIMYGPGGKPKGIVIGGRAAAKESDAESERKPPAAKRKRPAHTDVKISYSLRSGNKDSAEKERKGKEKEQETDVWEANPDTDEKGKGIAESSDEKSDISESD